MKDLCDLTGLPRQAIHFYIHEGLLPEGHKTGRNMAYYGPAHLARLRLIRRLQEEQFLPLKAIRAMLDEQDDAFTPAQRRLLADVKERIGPALGARDDARDTVSLKDSLAKAGIDRKDFDELEGLGVIAAARGPRGKLVVAKDDAWILSLWGQVRAAGFTRARGFSPKNTLAMFEETVSKLFASETALVRDRLSHLPADEVARLVRGALPLVHTFLVRYHDTKVRSFFAALGERP